MSGIVLVQVPGEFARDLVSAGFDEVEPVRGGGFEAQAVLTVVSSAVALTADVATILVAKDAVEDFFRRLRSWMARRTGSAPGSEFTIKVSSHSPGASSQLIMSRRTEAGAAPEVDVEALASLLHSVLAAGGGSGKPAGAGPSAL